MEFVILTGLSGAGKTRAMHAMEDIGFYCVDNLPPALIPVFYDLCDKSEGIQRRVAVVTDTRGGELFKSFFSALETLKAQNEPYKILFMDASEPVLVNRFQETRRKHPLSEAMQGSLEQAVRLEREMLRPVKEVSDYVIDTSNIPAAGLKARISDLFCRTITTPLRCTASASALNTVCRLNPTLCLTCAACQTRSTWRSCANIPALKRPCATT